MEKGYSIIIKLNDDKLASCKMSKQDAIEGINEAMSANPVDATGTSPIDAIGVNAVLPGMFYIIRGDKHNTLLKAYKCMDSLAALPWFAKCVSEILMCEIALDSISDFIDMFREK